MKKPPAFKPAAFRQVGHLKGKRSYSADNRSMGQCNTNTKEDGAADDYSEDFLADGAHEGLTHSEIR